MLICVTVLRDAGSDRTSSGLCRQIHGCRSTWLNSRRSCSWKRAVGSGIDNGLRRGSNVPRMRRVSKYLYPVPNVDHTFLLRIGDIRRLLGLADIFFLLS
jgi:hypothetical protein